MPSSNLLALLDDIVTVLDDVALLTKVAAKKTSGVLGDDLALNAEQVAGVRAERELPVVWAVAKGSSLNKLILVPSALLISAVASFLVTPFLMMGGLYLCFEGVEKVFHKIFHTSEDKQEKEQVVEALHDPSVDMIEFEKGKIKGAIRTDFILSAEIIVIALGTVKDSPLLQQILVLSTVAVAMTIGVYGFVACLVKLDDVGLHLMKTRPANSIGARFGQGLLIFAPWLMRGLSIAGTIAMFLVGGSILMHGVPNHEQWTSSSFSIVYELILGVACGTVALAVVTGIKKWVFKKA